MENIISQFGKYLGNVLGLTVKPEKWAGEKGLPFFLQDSYLFYELTLLNTPCLMMIAKNDAGQTPATISKHVKQVRHKWEGEVIYVKQTLSSYNRTRLIEHKISFVVPGNQMYLPLLGIDLREHFRKARSARRKFSPSTQAVILNTLLGEERVFTPSCLARKLGYTVMTLTRALDELESAGIGEVFMDGRERKLHFSESNKDLWEKARVLMRSPVKKRHYLRYSGEEWPGVSSGLTALAHYSLLSPPDNPVYALGMAEWKTLKQRNEILEMPMPEPNSFEVEIWNYSPHLFATDNIIDRFSLYLSLQDLKDERVHMALDEMMDGIQW